MLKIEGGNGARSPLFTNGTLKQQNNSLVFKFKPPNYNKKKSSKTNNCCSKKLTNTNTEEGYKTQPGCRQQSVGEERSSLRFQFYTFLENTCSGLNNELGGGVGKVYIRVSEKNSLVIVN